ncbi:hypothetical protein C8Q76DRAFT_765256 [Earliella scabrosa]|nr:hypothetical protein C8Q76DRAFT_765256 [Earliella scabrosa]
MRTMPTFGACDYEAADHHACNEGLLPLRNDDTVADLLFELANWHALARLRVHTDILDNLGTATKHLYAAMNKFDETCREHQEAEARVRRAQAKNPHAEISTEPRPYHCLGDYVEYIRQSGPTENFNSQVVRN